MYVLRIEHPVPNFDGWKKAFDSDPIGRERMRVRRHRVLRAVDDPNFAIIDLEFDSAEEAESALAALRQLWSRVEGTVMTNPQVRIAELVESQEP